MFFKHQNSRMIALAMSIVILFAIMIVPDNHRSYGAAAKSKTVNSWYVFQSAVTDLKNKKYELAYSKFKSSEKGMIARGSKINTAILYKHLGTCKAKLGDYKQADAYWMNEAAWWKKAGYLQDAIHAERKAYLIRQDIRLFTVGMPDSKDKLIQSHMYHGAKYEPLVGTFIGAYAANDKYVENKALGKDHSIEFPKLTGKDHAGYLYYYTYGGKMDRLIDYANKLKMTGGVMQIAIQPMKGLSEVQDDETLNYIAQTIADMEIPVFIRFANEMNDPTSKWYEKNPQDYIKKYRMVAKKMREKAPNAVLVWAPLYFPPHNLTWYYPGDDVVDWVGISIYRQYHPELDPVWDKSMPADKAVDRFKFADHFKTIYDLYADKKPIFVSECGVSYQHDVNGNDITPFAVNELSDYYTYVPMLYPKMKALFYFDENVKDKHTRYQLSTSKALLQTYQEGIKNPYYLGHHNETATIQYQELPNYKISAEEKSLFAYVKSYDPTVSAVSYEIGDKSTEKTTGIKPIIKKSSVEPYEVKVDFSVYEKKSIPVKIKAYNNKGVVVAEEIINIKVSAKKQ